MPFPGDVSAMYNVLIPVDRNRERAVHQAEYVVQLAGVGEPVEATVLHVVPPGRFERSGDMEFEAVEAAVAAADLLSEADVPVDRVVGDGSVANEIVRAAVDRDVDEIVVGGRKRSGMVQVLLGSTVHDLLLSTDRPVTVADGATAAGEGQRRLLLPVDRDVNRSLHQANYVAGLPDPSGIEATVLYVFPHQDYRGAPPHEFAEVGAAVKAADRLEEAGVSVERAAVGGEVARTILRTAEERDVDGIVVGGRKRSGVQEVIMGSTAMDLMLSAGRPVTLTG
jgi:nucleotide-binding universal stress UspA family protein